MFVLCLYICIYLCIINNIIDKSWKILDYISKQYRIDFEYSDQYGHTISEYLMQEFDVNDSNEAFFLCKKQCPGLYSAWSDRRGW